MSQKITPVDVVPKTPHPEDDACRPSTRGSTAPYFFGLDDFTSDYYQVLIEQQRPKWCKSLWTLIVLAILVFLGYVCYLLIADYASFGSYNKIVTVTTNSSILLPGITICSMNYMNYSAIQLELTESNPEVAQQFESLMYAAEMLEDPSTVTFNESDYEDLIEYEAVNGTIAYKYSNHVYDFISSATYDYKLGRTQYIIENWVTGMGTQQLGSCIEFNDEKIFTQSVAGSAYGLTIDLDASISSYLPSTQTGGFKVFLRNHDETVLFDEGGYVIGPGEETFIEVSLDKKSRLGSPWGSCQNNVSPLSKYGVSLQSTNECFQYYRIKRMIQDCSCIPWYVAYRLLIQEKFDLMDEFVSMSQADEYDDEWDARKRRDTSERRRKNRAGEAKSRKKRTSDETTTEFWEGEYDNFEEYVAYSNYSDYYCDFFSQTVCELTFSYEWAELKNNYTCHEPCSYDTYEVSMSRTIFPPTEAYFDTYIKFDSYKDSSEYDYNYARNNMARLHIFYEDISYTTTTQTADYEIQNFIGNIGGTVDLFIGFSFFTVFQLFEITIAMVYLKIFRKRRAEN